ncbi:MAG: DUF2997 domain-containing protein [Planctomycetota bacterium]
MSKRIEITVDPKGDVKVATLGFVGRTCRLASAFLEKALGIVIEDKATTQAEEQQQCQNKYQQ